MDMKLTSGDYVPDSSVGYGFLTVSGGDELLQRVLFRLTAHRGGFPFIPELGSRFWLLPREKKSNRKSAAMQFAIEALSDMSGISVEDVSVTETDDCLEVYVKILYSGETYTLTVDI